MLFHEALKRRAARNPSRWNATPLFGFDAAQHEPERAVGILAGIWALLFCLPLFFLMPDSPGTSRSAGRAISQGLRNLAETIRKIRNFRNVVTFLIARVLFYEGFIVLMLFTGVFASGTRRRSSSSSAGGSRPAGR